LISFVKGTAFYIDNENLVVDNHGIGYQIKTTRKTLDTVICGTDIMLYTCLYVREDIMALYGFQTRTELEVFQILLGISGIGPKAALAVLSTLSVEELYYAVLSDDSRTISRTPGIGPKGAKRMIMELKDKLKLEDIASSGPEGEEGSFSAMPECSQDQMTDTVDALTALGYSVGEAYRAVHKVADAAGMDSGQLLKKALEIISSRI